MPKKKAQIKGQCNRCGHKNINSLEVHHRDRNRSNNESYNLEVLCANCHRLEHRKPKPSPKKNRAAVHLGRKGGQQTFAKLGRNHFKRAGLASAAKRKARAEAILVPQELSPAPLSR